MLRHPKILWRDRDVGEKLSIVMFAILGVGMLAMLLAISFHKLVNGPEITDRLFGAVWPVLIAIWAFRGVRWWRQRDARR